MDFQLSDVSFATLKELGWAGIASAIVVRGPPLVSEAVHQLFSYVKSSPLEL